MCVGLVCVQVCNCGSGTVSRCVSVDPVQCPYVCGSSTVSGFTGVRFLYTQAYCK